MLVCSNCRNANPDGARFCNGCGTSLGSPVAAGESRRTVTAVFCDLVGSTTLGETHDPEVLRPILERYFAEMRAAVERHGGRVEKFIGDAVVGIFGLPVAHEDDGLRAVRAAVEMQERLASLNEASGIPLAARIGATTGEVLVPGGDTPIIGDAMNTASRLQSAAGSGEVLIGESTWRLVRGAVATEAVEPLHAKGKAEPVSAWRVLSLHAVQTRSATPFVGRDRHMGILDGALEDAIDADASVLVTILAPPGVGKSRLADAFVSEVRERTTVLVGQTPSYGEGVTFAPLVELLSQAAGRPSGEAEQVAASLRARLAAEPDGPSVGDRLARSLGVGEALGADTAWAVRRLLEVLAAEQPLVVVLEDVHWAEPPMLDLVDAVVEHVHGRVLFLCLARPELLEQRPGWAAGKHRAVTTTLPPLAPADTRRIAKHLLGEEAPTSVVDSDLRDGRREPAVRGAAHGDAEGPRSPRRRRMDRFGPCRDRDPRDVAGAHRGTSRPPRSRAEPDPRASLRRGPSVPSCGRPCAGPGCAARRGGSGDRLLGAERPRPAGRRDRRPLALRARAPPRGGVPASVEGAASGAP